MYRGQQPFGLSTQMRAILTLKSYISNGGLIPLTGNNSLGNLADRARVRTKVEDAIKAAEKEARDKNQQIQVQLDQMEPKYSHGQYEENKYNVVQNKKRLYEATYISNVNYSVSANLLYISALLLPIVVTFVLFYQRFIHYI